MSRLILCKFSVIGRSMIQASSSASSYRSPSLVVPSFRSIRQFSSYDDGYYSEEEKMSALVLGSSGALGRSVTRHLTENLNMRVIGADVVDLPDDNETSLTAFISTPTWSQHPGAGDVTRALVSGLCNVLDNGEEIDVIVCASGGWQGDPEMPTVNASKEEYIAGATDYGDSIDRMMEMNLFPVLAAEYAAKRFMANEGLFVVVGATAALSPTPGMLGYGLSKVGAHHYIQTIGEMSGKSVTTKSRRKKARALRKDNEYLDTLSIVGILPTTIDTPANRNAMPDADFNQWTKPQDIATEIGTWIKMPPLRPHSGSLVKVFPNKTGGGASFNLVR